MLRPVNPVRVQVADVPAVETARAGIVPADAVAVGSAVEAGHLADKVRFKREVFRFPA